VTGQVRVAVLSFWHVHAKDYARAAAEHPAVDLVAAWDEDAARGREWADEFGIGLAPSLPALLSRDDVDAVVVTAPTAAHRDVLVAAAEAGKHIFTEKVLATTVRECADVVAAAGRAGVALVVSLPRLYDAPTLAIRRLLADGRLGRLASVRVRLAHGGAVGDAWLPERFFDPAVAGGGALIDLGCHPMYLARLLLGALPESVTASFGALTGRAVEDGAVAVLHQADGALGIVEAGFVTPHLPFAVEAHGTEGSLLYGLPEPRLLLRAGPDPEGGWSEVPLPDPEPSPFERFVAHIRDGTRDPENVAMAADLTRLMAAAYESASTGTTVALKEGNILA
jgi:1,5-anhydro-D-fructose reductase (1,5-anhydro-D-mannitol-forming)